ncbi:MAG: alanine racemase C-terminal domain-containing protein, partial [Verrucomicrobiota bacterium]
MGYADRYPRLLSNRGSVFVHRQRAPVCGQITMDQTLIDVTSVPRAQVGDEVCLMGQSGEESLLASEIAEETGTISYEILCGVGKRVQRAHLILKPFRNCI